MTKNALKRRLEKAYKKLVDGNLIECANLLKTVVEMVMWKVDLENEGVKNDA